MKNKSKSDWISTTEMAKLLGCSVDHLYRMIKSGHFKKGKHWYVVNPSAYRVTYRWNYRAVKQELIGRGSEG